MVKHNLKTSAESVSPLPQTFYRPRLSLKIRCPKPPLSALGTRYTIRSMFVRYAVN